MQLAGFDTLQDGTNASVGTTAAQVTTTDVIATSVLIQADPDNTDDIFLGNATSQSVQLQPGQSIAVQINNVNKLYAKSASGTQRANHWALK